MAGATLLVCSGGRVVLPIAGGLLIDREDGGHLIVNPPRGVWERSELTADELREWGELVSSVGRAMIDALPQLEDGCANYWEAGNWSLHEDAEPPGPKRSREARRVHQHVIGRSRTASNPSWTWGEAPVFPRFAGRRAWSRDFRPLTADECRRILRVVRLRVSARGLSIDTSTPRLAVLDIAGTTVEDGGQVVKAFLAALREAGLSPSEDQIANVRGSSKREAIRAFFPGDEARALRVFERFRGCLRDLYEAEARAIPGAFETIGEMRRAGIRVVLNTGFDRATSDRLLAAMNVDRGSLDGVVCGDDVANGRPAPDMIVEAMRISGVSDPSLVAAVGDTTLDLRAGSSAGVGWNIGVLSGAHDSERLAGVAHTHLVPDVNYLSALWLA